MRFLEGEDEIETRYGGGYVKSIDGVSEDERGGHPYDWFFYVNGVESPVGAAEVSLHGGEKVWWDIHDWSASEHVPAVVGSWPAPFTTGWEGHEPVVASNARAAARPAGRCEAALEGEERDVDGGRASSARSGRRAEGGDPGAGRAVGEAALRPGRGAARKRARRKAGSTRTSKRSGGAWRLVGLDENGKKARTFGAGRRAWSRRPATTKGRRSGWSPAGRARPCGRRRKRSTRPTCATITRWRARRGR